MPENSLLPGAGLKTLDYVAVVLYMASTFGIAVWFGRKQKTTDDFFVGGRACPGSRSASAFSPRFSPRCRIWVCPEK